MVDRIRWDTVSYLPFYYVFFQFLLLTIFNLQANILTTKDILSNLDLNMISDGYYALFLTRFMSITIYFIETIRIIFYFFIHVFSILMRQQYLYLETLN